MSIIRYINTLLLITLLSFAFNSSVNAKPTSGVQNLVATPHQGQTIFIPLMHQGKTDVSTIDMSGYTLGPKGVSEKVLNRANHVFEPKSLKKHNLGGVLDKFSGDQIKAFQSLEKATQKLASQGQIDGIFKSVVKVKGVDITVTGKVIDGTVNIGTAFIP